MLKLKDLLTLDEIKYAGSIKPKHQKRMERELKHIYEVQVKHMPPPDNSSKETRLELNWLKNYNDGKVDEDMVKRGDNIKNVYREYCEDYINLLMSHTYLDCLLDKPTQIIHTSFNIPSAFIAFSTCFSV